jgi:3-isopropylmalate/(R)-2-methylmalate dehydratase large subunit
MNIIEQYLAKAAGVESLELGQDVRCAVDLVVSHDVTAPMAITRFREIGVDRVFSREGVVMIMDHIVPAATVKAREGQWAMKDFAEQYGIKLYERSEGVCHQLVGERHRLAPGGIVVGADSHTGTCGGYGVIGIGVGSTEAAAAMATGYVDVEVPPVIRCRLSGRLPGNVFGKDVVLHLLRQFGTAGLTDKALLLTGTAAQALSEEERMTICNMGIEMGAFITLFDLTADAAVGGAGEFAQTIDVVLDELEPLAACPPSPGNVKAVRELAGVHLSQIVVGSCTNGRLNDMWQLVVRLKGKKVADSVALLVIPASDRVLAGMEERGWTKLLRDAGAVIANPGCGPCFGAHQGLVTMRDVVASTTNRNFPGRMGHRDGRIYLVSPATAAASALVGSLTVPDIQPEMQKA